jgi:sterol 3beta-glucosyltransferase
MYVTLIALGSRGDVLPALTLGKALRGAGCQVRVATMESMAGWVAECGLALHPIRGDIQAMLQSGAGQALAASGRSVPRMALAVMRMFRDLAAGYAQDMAGLAGLETDLIVNQLPGALYGYDLAEKLGVPMVAMAVMPLVPSAATPMLAFPAALAPLPGYNLGTHWLAYQIVWQIFRRPIDRWRKETLGLAGAPFWGVFDETRRRIPVLNGFSAHLVPRAPDWGAQVHVTGYWFPEEPAWQPPEGLARFVEAGPPPVFVGFGSMPMRDPARTTRTVLDALAWSGQRAILGAGWGGVGRGDLPKSVFPVEYVPYGWLFPRMAAVVHHGGSGTTHATARAGVPGVVVPFLFDQFYWGRRVHALGVGPRPVPFRALSARRLGGAIAAAVTDDGMRRRAAALGAAVRAEGGVEAAVALILREA